MNFSVQTRLLPTPYFVIFRLSICAQLTNVRITRFLLAISSLLNSPLTASPSVPHLAGKVHHSGARGIPLTTSPKLHVVGCGHQLYMFFSTGLHRDAMHTFTPIRGSRTHVSPFFSFWSLVFMISVFGSLYPHALPPSASPAMLFAGDCAKRVPF